MSSSIFERVFLRSHCGIFINWIIGAWQKCPLYGDVRFIEIPSKNQKSSKVNMKPTICHDLPSPDLLEGPKQGQVKKMQRTYTGLNNILFNILFTILYFHYNQQEKLEKNYKVHFENPSILFQKSERTHMLESFPLCSFLFAFKCRVEEFEVFFQIIFLMKHLRRTLSLEELQAYNSFTKAKLFHRVLKNIYFDIKYYLSRRTAFGDCF